MAVSSKSSRPRSYFSYVTEAGTVLAMVFAYLNGKTLHGISQREGKQRAMDALLAFWKPYALRAQSASDQTIREAAQASVAALFRQIQTIRDDFGIDLPPSSTPAVNWENLLVSLVAHLEKSPRGEALIPAIAPPPNPETSALSQHPNTEEIIYVDDEDLLGDLE